MVTSQNCKNLVEIFASYSSSWPTTSSCLTWQFQVDVGVRDGVTRECDDNSNLKSMGIRKNDVQVAKLLGSFPHVTIGDIAPEHVAMFCVWRDIFHLLKTEFFAMFYGKNSNRYQAFMTMTHLILIKICHGDIRMSHFIFKGQKMSCLKVCKFFNI